MILNETTGNGTLKVGLKVGLADFGGISFGTYDKQAQRNPGQKP